MEQGRANGGRVLSDSDRLDVSFSQRPDIGRFVNLAIMIAIAVTAWVGAWVPRPLIGLYAALLFAAFVIYIRDAGSRRQTGTVIVLDRDGIAVSGSPTIPWTNVREITVTQVGSRWLTAGRLFEVVAFIPGEGVDMPDPPTYAKRARTTRVTERWRALRLERYGTNLTLAPYLMTASTEQIVGVAQRWTDVPVTRLPTPRKWRLALLIAPTLVLATFLVLVVAILVH